MKLVSLLNVTHFLLKCDIFTYAGLIYLPFL